MTGETTGSASRVAYAAIDLAKEAKLEILSHEKICAERYANINQTLTDLKNETLPDMKAAIDEKFNMIWKIIAWAGGAAFLIIMGLLSYLAKTQFEVITQQQRIANQPQVIQQAAPPPQVIIQRADGSPAIGATVERSPKN